MKRQTTIHLILCRHNNYGMTARLTRGHPALESGEIAYRLSISVDDSAFEAPAIILELPATGAITPELSPVEAEQPEEEQTN